MAKLTTAQRDSLPRDDFALPQKIHKGPRGKKITKGARPIQSPHQAKVALTVGMRGASPTEKTEIREAVHRKYPGIGKGKKSPRDDAPVHTHSHFESLGR